jgi:hypothetical protein
MRLIHRAITLAFAAGAGAAAVAAPAHAQDQTLNAPPPPAPESPSTITGSSGYRARLGPQLGARVAYAAGFGVVYSGLDVWDASHGALPIIVDLGWRVVPALYVGAYGQYAPVFTRSNPVSCPTGFDCSANDWRFGVQADLHFVPQSRLDPYVALGTGWEILDSHMSGTAAVPTPLGGSVPGNVHTDATNSGWEFVNLSLGFDARIDSMVGVGPFVTGSLGQYGTHNGTQTIAVGGTTVQNGLPPLSSGLHELVFAGVRGTFNP